MRPPKRACDELDGMPNNHVARVPHRMPPHEAGEHDQNYASPLTDPRLTTPFATVAATPRREKGADQVQGCRECHCDLRSKCAGGDGGGHRVSGVVEAVREIESEGSDDHYQRTTSSAVTTELCVSKAQKYSEQPANRRCASPHSAITSHDGPGTVATLTSICRCVGPHSSVSLTGTGSRRGCDARYASSPPGAHRPGD